MARFTPQTIAGVDSSIVKVNSNFEEIADLVEDFVSRSGEASNEMLSDLDMNHFRIKNLDDAINNADAVPMGQLASLVPLYMAKGDPGGNVLSVGLFNQIGAMSIPEGTDIIRTSGFSVEGKGAAFYVRTVAVYTWGENIWWKTAGDGSMWELAEIHVTSDMFGTLGDATTLDPFKSSAGVNGTILTYPNLLLSVSGTDVTEEIQNMIDYGLYKGLGAVYLSKGGHLTSQCLHLGYHANHSLSLIGEDNNMYGAWAPTMGGCSIIATHSDAPIVNIQASRRTKVANINFKGLLSNWIASQNLGNNASDKDPALDDTDEANWNGSSLSANQDTRYTPFAAVAIDGYSGVQPATHYPDVSYPAWTGIVTQYNKAFSSNVRFENCTFEGVIAGVAVQPSDIDSNGDFTNFEYCQFTNCKYGISIGNTQSRNVGLSNCIADQIFCMFEGRTHGRQNGRFQGVIENFSIGACIQLLNVTAGISLPMNFDGGYAEGVWRIGNIIGASSSPIIFDGFLFKMDMVGLNNTRGTPTNHLSGSTTRHIGSTTCSAPVRFRGISVTAESVLVLIAQDVSFDGTVRPTERDSGTIDLYESFAHNGLAGGLVLFDFGDGLNYNFNISATYKGIDATTGLVGADQRTINNRMKAPTLSRKYGVPVYTRELDPATGGTPVAIRPRFVQLSKGAFSSASFTGRNLTMTWTGTVADSESNGLRPGDVLIDRDTGSTLFVSSFDTGTKILVARLQNNYKGLPGSETITQTISLTTGTWACMPTRWFTTDYPLFVDSQTTFTSLGDTTNTSVDVANVIGATTRMIGLMVSGTGIPAGTYVVAVNGPAIKLSAAATATNAGVTLTFGTASTVLRNATTADGNSINLTNGSIVAGDFITALGYTDNLAAKGTTISSIDTTNKTITLSGNALENNYRKRIAAFRAAPPANDTTPGP